MEELVNKRTGARRKDWVPAEVLAALRAGTAETVNLMEWLAADMEALARVLAAEAADPSRRAIIGEAAGALSGKGVLARLSTMGSAIARAEPDPGHPWRISLSEHRSDLVRQWACYAANDGSLDVNLESRLLLTLPFAADGNMSVREAAWMAFRPYVARCVCETLALLLPLSRSNDPNVRRFCVEVTRPRSVWGAHIKDFKEDPSVALPMLERVKNDPALYVRLALGNWLNDASKSRPAWVAGVCAAWEVEDTKAMRSLIRRARRTIDRPVLVVPARPIDLFSSAVVENGR